MARYVANRLAQAIMLLVIVSAIGFAMLHLAPGGPLSQFAASAQMTQEDLDRVTKQLGLDRSLPIQSFSFGAQRLNARVVRLMLRNLELLADGGGRSGPFVHLRWSSPRLSSSSAATRSTAACGEGL